MYCRKCGALLSDDAAFCVKCGTPTRAAQSAGSGASEPPAGGNAGGAASEPPAGGNAGGAGGEPPAAGNASGAGGEPPEPPRPDRRESKKERKARKKAQRAKRTIGQKIRGFFIRLLVLLLAVVLVVVWMNYMGMIRISSVGSLIDRFGDRIGSAESESVDIESYKVEPPDADAYYEQNSQVIAVIGAKESDAVPTETESAQLLSDRGFGDYPVVTEYSMDGEYYRAEEITGDSSQKHPMYQTYYISSSEELWTIFVINGSVIANPVSYNLESTRSAQLLISESEIVTSYDSTTNQFYQTIPNESEAIVRVVDRIDAGTLDSLTAEVIAGL